MTHSLIIEEVLAHPQEISWLPRAVQYFFSLALPPARRCSPACSTGVKSAAAARKPDAADRPDLCHHRPAGADRGSAPDRARLAFLCLSDTVVMDAVGALFLPLFTGFLGLWFLAQQVKRFTHKSYSVTRWLAVGSALSAIGLLVYTGREVSVVQARPIWFSYAFPLAMFLSALQTFFALLIASINRDSTLPRKLACGQIVTLIAPPL